MMLFYSTTGSSSLVGLEHAVMQGLAPDGGLYMPKSISRMPDAFFHRMRDLSFAEICFEVAKALLQDSIPIHKLKSIIDQSIDFDAPLKKLTEEIFVLELFHGPTLSFKDFGARFMAQLMAYFHADSAKTLNILVATSGDTGSAIAQAFLGIPHVKVWILFPKGKVSKIQEMQLTTAGHNVTALEVDGAFDDCQRLVKQAFSDPEVRESLSLTSANSINIARLIPQMFYYFYAYAQLTKHHRLGPVVFSVPSGNFGNLTAGLMAKKMGLPLLRFVAATNINDTVPRYLHNGIFEPRPSLPTMSNAMDVGNPSNFARMLDLYDRRCDLMNQDIAGVSFTDAETESGMREAHKRYGYLLDPHGAIGYLGLKAYFQQHSEKALGVVLETAHPAKFKQDVERVLGIEVELPHPLKEALAKKRCAMPLPNEYKKLKALLCPDFGVR